MSSLWIGLSLLVVMAVLVLLLAVWRWPRLQQRLVSEHKARNAENVRLFKQKLAALEQAHAAGELDAPAYQQQRHELEDSLLADTEQEAAAEWRSGSNKTAMMGVVVVALIMILGAAGLYRHWGGADEVAAYFTHQQLVAEGQQDFGKLLKRLEQTVEEHPDDPQGWSLLARIYLDMGRYEQGGQALEQIMRLQGRQPVFLAQTAQAYYFADQRQMSSRVKTLIDEALEANPSQSQALSLLGMHAYQSEQWASALDYWERALASAQSPEAEKALTEGVNELRIRLGQAPLQAQASFAVKVDLSNRARMAVSEDDVVYVLARRPDLPMPLAVARLKVSDLPTTVVLDDGQAMSPQARLSQAEQVLVQARVSRHGDPKAQPGDWQGGSDTPLAVDGRQEVNIVIDQRLETDPAS